jgi:bifunctional non-homologous end joining protein LigD
VPDENGLRYAGRVGTGFSDRDRRDIYTRLSALAEDETPLHDVPAAEASKAHWVRPELVGEVTFTEWTGSGSLRHPSWRGWRPDKSPDDVRIE